MALAQQFVFHQHALDAACQVGVLGTEKPQGVAQPLDLVHLFGQAGLPFVVVTSA